jgi:SAM-dependent methyltransferase
LRKKEYPPFLPPEHLRVRIGGVEDANAFLNIGAAVGTCIARLLIDIDKPIDRCRSILDFGCGCGRILRWLPLTRARITGVDIDPEAIGWCKHALGSLARFRVAPHMPPLPFRAGKFDLIYAISVFTHLPEDMGRAWIGEMARVLEPGGVLIASLLGPSVFAPPGTPERAVFDSRGFYHTRDVATAGLPDFYGTSYHNQEYIEREWGSSFDILGYHEKAIVNHQDAVVCSRR